ncbi:MAG: hypothetical protein Kow00128_19550 [Deltaproteobacteria bacterium]
MKRSAAVLGILCCLASPVLAASAGSGPEKMKGAIWAVSDGRGTVSLFWLPPGNRWPEGGWRLERLSGGKPVLLADRILPGGDEEALRSLPPAEAEGIRKFATRMKEGRMNDEEGKLSGIVFGTKAALDPAFGRALGLRYTDRSPGERPVSYRLTELDRSGRTGRAITGREIDPRKESPLPPPVPSVRAEPEKDTVRIVWEVPPSTESAPAVAFLIERASGGAVERLTAAPLLAGRSTSGDGSKGPFFIDPDPPLEEDLVYSVSSVDFFGRTSRAVSAKIFLPDPTAGIPPSGVKAEAGEGSVEIRWKRNDSPRTAGYLVERSMLHDGMYENLTPKGLPHDRERFRDTQVLGGATYYYRVRSIDPRGKPGHPSEAVAAQPKAAEAPPAPEGLRAEIGNTRIRLVWEPVPFPAAGYFVFRKSGSSGSWARLNDLVTPEPAYDIPFGPHNAERFRFRVVAIGLDSRESRPSGEIEVRLPDTLPPGTPSIRAASGEGGTAKIEFVPASPEEDTDRFLVLRCMDEKDPGIVIGDPLPGNARSFEDPFVEPGKGYFYRVVALDRAGNRSDASRPAAIQVGTPRIPVPARPKLSEESSPFPHVLVRFEPPPPGFSVLVQVQRGGKGGWKRLTGPAEGIEEAIDPKSASGGGDRYRVVYQAGNGIRGEPSEPAVLPERR